MLGTILLIAGALIGGFFLFSFLMNRQESKTAAVGSTSNRIASPAELPTDRLSSTASAKERVAAVQSGQTVTLLGDKERAVKATITLKEMTQPDTDANPNDKSTWRATGNVYNIIELAGDVYLIVLPSREGGKPMWLKAAEVELFKPLMPFWRGTEEKPGPAKAFKNNGQTDPVPFTLPKGVGDATNWEVIDIGQLSATVNGKSDNFYTGDFYPFVTAREVGGEHYLVDIVSTKDLARGSGGCYKGEKFEPDVEVAALL
jgi:hypothetical protein